MKKMIFGAKPSTMLLQNNNSGELSKLVGICLAKEQSSDETCNNDPDNSKDMFIGCILVQPDLTPLTEFRALIMSQMENKPLNFRFLTDRHWPVNLVQEGSLSVQNVMGCNDMVFIQSVFENARIGVQREDGLMLGFIFTDVKDTAVTLRENINTQLMDAFCKEDFIFLDHNSWPVTRKQEIWLTVLDLVQGSIIVIRPSGSSSVSTPEIPAEKLGFPRDMTDIATGVNASNSVESGISTLSHASSVSFTSSLPQKRKLSHEGERVQHSFQHGSQGHPTPLLSSDQIFQHGSQHHPTSLLPSDQIFQHGSQQHPMSLLPRDPTLLSPEGVFKKQILISYVRTEAASHSLELKQELESLGFSVYLDVDEIKIGTDWQDSLNDAVMSCEVFVPLVTQRYGETQWTNREVKLADVLGKFILPINFLEDWPPRCLAIQFATTQFIPWCKPFKKRMKPLNWHNWDKDDLQYISGEIANRCIAEIKRKIESTDQVDGVPSLTTNSSSLKSYAVPLPSAKLNRELTKKLESVRAPKPGKPLVVICCHGDEHNKSNDLKTMLIEQNFDVWSTTELFKPGEFPSGPPNKTLPPYETSKRCIFQKKANEAAVVVVLLSDAFANALICHQMLFYCEHRKFLILVKCEEFSVPPWLELLLNERTILEFIEDDFEDSIIRTVRYYVGNEADMRELSSSPISESQSMKLLNETRMKMPSSAGMVHLVGGSDPSQRIRDICKHIGEALYQDDKTTLVYSAGSLWFDDIITGIASSTSSSLDENSIINIIPHTYQDGPSQGIVSANIQTVHCGKNVKQKNSVVAQLVNICVLIGHCPGDAANLVEQFVYNDRVVIPLTTTEQLDQGDATSINQSIYNKPCGVEQVDWEMLQNPALPAWDIAQTFMRVMRSVRIRPCDVSPTSSKGSQTSCRSLFSSLDYQLAETQEVMDSEF